MDRIFFAIAENDEAHPGVVGRIEGIARGRQVERRLDETAVVLETDIAGETQARTAIDDVVDNGGLRDPAHDLVADSAPSCAQLRDEILAGKIVDQHVTTLRPDLDGWQDNRAEKRQAVEN